MSDKELLHLELSVDDVLIFEFNGVVTQNTIVAIAKAVESTLLETDEEESRVRTIFELIVEIMQNILSYSADSINIGNNTYESKCAIGITFRTDTKRYKLKSANHVYKEKKKGLQECLDEANSIPLDEVKEAYKARRRERRRVHSRGAGLGFLDMIRKSKHKLKYSFEDDNEKDKVYFELYVKV